MADPEWWENLHDYSVVQTTTRAWEISRDYVESIVLDVLRQRTGLPLDVITTSWDRCGTLTIVSTARKDITEEDTANAEDTTNRQ